jgi:ABC-2 type transport system ATP-binding protein
MHADLSPSNSPPGGDSPLALPTDSGDAGMISLEGVQFGYAHAPLFRSLDLELAPGTVCGLLGKNGAGKTTLMKIMSGLRFAQGGRVRVLGFDPAARQPEFLAKVFYLPETIALPNVLGAAYVRELAPFYPEFDHALYQELVTDFALPVQTALCNLSLGEARKIMLAFALGAGCRLLLLDEPANGLDIPSRKQLRTLLARAMREDRAIVISTHQVHEIEALVDTIAILHGGNIVVHQPVDELTRRIFIGTQAETPEPANTLYSERAVGGWLVVKERTAEPESTLDLETLFQAAVADPDRLKAIFGRKETYVRRDWHV